MDISLLYAPNQPITLAEENIVELNGDSVDLASKTVLQMVPTPRVLIEVDESLGLPLPAGNFDIKMSTGAQLKVWCISTKVRVGESAKREAQLVPIRQPIDVYDKKSPIKTVHFGIMNFPILYGRQAKKVWDARHSTWRLIPHAELRVSGWCVEITGVTGIDEMVTTLKRDSGYGFTYRGKITRIDGRSFLSKETDILLTVLRTFLSFARGAHCSIALVEGLDEYNQSSWLRWGAHTAEPWGIEPSWIGLTEGTDMLSELFPSFWKLVTSEEMPKDTLLRAIEWYLQSNASLPYPYVGIIITLAGLELLSRQVLEREIWNKEKSGDFIRAALETLDIPTDIPKSFRELLAANNWAHGPHAVVAIRNDLVHPRPTIKNVSAHATFEAWNLGQWYLEMMLLRVLSYNGMYQNRLTQGWRDQLEPVPWAASGTLRT